MDFKNVNSNGVNVVTSKIDSIDSFFGIVKIKLKNIIQNCLKCLENISFHSFHFTN
jgi:hypothetical protein